MPTKKPPRRSSPRFVSAEPLDPEAWAIDPANPAAADPERPARFQKAVLWSHRPTFGPFVRRLREEKGISLRGAARDLGVSFNYLAKLETGGRIRPPSPDLIQGLADLLGQEVSEVMREAGFDTEVPESLKPRARIDRQFKRLMNHSDLRPLRVEPGSLDYYSTLQKLQVLRLVANLDRVRDEDGRGLRELLGSEFTLVAAQEILDADDGEGDET